MLKPLHINLNPSYFTFLFIAFVYVGAGGCIGASSIPKCLQACSQLIILAHFLYLLACYGWYFNSRGITAIHYYPDGYWYLQQKTALITVKLTKSCVIMKQIMIVHFVDEVWNQSYYLLLCPQRGQASMLREMRRVINTCR